MTVYKRGFVMFSKIRTSRYCILGLLIALPLLCSCAEESQPADEPVIIELSGGSTQCLSDISDTFVRYVHGDLPESELREFWRCTREAVQMFLDLTRGRQNTESYSKNEVKTFLEDYFLGDLVLSPELVTEFMYVKRLFVAGSLENVSRTELVQTKAILTRFEELTVRLRPYMRLIFLGLDSPGRIQPSVQEVEQAEQVLLEVGSGLGTLLEGSRQEYTLENLKALAQEIGKVLQSQSPSEPLPSWLEYLPLLTEIKNLLVVETEDSPSDNWTQFFTVGADLIGAFIRYRFFIEPNDWKQGPGFEQMHLLVLRMETLIRQALEMRPSKAYSPREFVSLAESLSRLKVLPEEVTPDVIESVFEVLVQRFLKDGASDRLEFNLNHLSQLRSEYWRWHSAQVYLQERDADIQGELNLNPAIEEMRRVLEGPWALRRDEQGRLVFDFSQHSDLASMSILNLQRAAIRLLIRGYAEDPQRRETLAGLSKEELQLAAEELYLLGEAFGLFSNNDTSIASRIFLEGNLFMPRANGDQILSFEEGVEYFSFVLSGLSVSGLIFDELKAVCPSRENDGGTKISIDCFRTKVSEQRHRYLENMPHLIRYLDSGTSDLWTSLELNLERALRGPDLSQPISRSEILEMWVLLQYVETFFGRFDANGSTTVNVEEALASFPVFEPILTELLGGFFAGEGEILAFFTFMMRYGETPFNAKWGGELKFLHWKWHRHQWSFEANRLRILSILAELNELI